MDTDPTTESAPPEQSPAAPAAAGDVSVLADLFADPDPGPDLPEDGPVAPAWVTLGDPGGPDASVAGLSPRRVLVQLTLGVVAALLVVGVVGTLAARTLAEREAVNDAATMAGVLAKAVVEPALSDALVAGDPAAIAAFDDVARAQLLSPDSIVRV